MAGGPSVDPWMSWIHRWPRTDPSPSLGPPEAANGLRGPWDLRRLPGPNSLFECYVRVARPWCCWGRGWFAWYLWLWCGSRHDKFRILKFYLVRLFGLLRPFRFRFFPTGRPPLFGANRGPRPSADGLGMAWPPPLK